jgi:hypothetical protein
MTKYLKRTGISEVVSYQPEGMNMYIPHDPANSDYSRMMEEVEAGTSTIEEIDDTP